ncbi:MAG: hypothetical protein KAS46_06900 [Candidatus Aureabacteria bacterium]|nr:hypothetical protein [Candidatus Auribacterota bacterium]
MKKKQKIEIDALKAQVASKSGKKLLRNNDIIIKEDKELVDYTRLIKNLDTKSISYVGIKPIPIKNIIGSVDRYTDFTSKFFTAKDIKSAKYLSVLNAIKSGKELAPIKVYQVLDNYFVIDGHHRVTVAKNVFKTEFIDAEITKVGFELDLKSAKKYTYNSATAKKFLILLEEKSFEEKTHLKNNILKYPIKVTNLTSFAKLYEAILSFKEYHDKGRLKNREIIYAAYEWYENIFIPAIHVIFKDKLLKDFPDRTYTDLYVWVSLHKYYLSQEVGYDVGFDFSKKDFIKKFKPEKITDIIPSIFTKFFKGIARPSREKGNT